MSRHDRFFLADARQVARSILSLRLPGIASPLRGPETSFAPHRRDDERRRPRLSFITHGNVLMNNMRR